MPPIARSKLTVQGRVSVPAGVRRRLGVEPGAVLEWADDGGAIVVRRAGRYSSEDVHRRLFPGRKPKSRTIGEIKEAIRRHTRKKHTRRGDERPRALITRAR